MGSLSSSSVVGLIAALALSAPALLYSAGLRLSALPLRWIPLALLAVGLAAALAQRLILDRKPGSRRYDGLSDLFIHIHSPAVPDSVVRWAVRGGISFLLAAFGGWVGPEGAAIEIAHAWSIKVRSRSSRWFEQRRRQDAGAAIAAGVSASFAAPLAGIVMPIELGIGGRASSSVVAAFSAYLGVRYLATFTQFERFSLGGTFFDFRFSEWRVWGAALFIGLVAGVVSAGLIRLIQFFRRGALAVVGSRLALRPVLGALLLAAVVWAHPEGVRLPWVLLPEVLAGQRLPPEVLALLISYILGLALALATFGSLGVFWPVFAIGGFLGFCVNQWAFAKMPGFSAAAVLIGASAAWGGVFGAPMTGAIAVFELTQNFQMLLPCWLAGLLAQRVRRELRTLTLIESDMKSRSFLLIEGRSSSVLSSVKVREAMVTDHETVQEQESVSELYARLLKSRYPFLPVVNAQGVYTGLLTVDMVQEAWKSQQPGKARAGAVGAAERSSPLSSLLEAKDLLYRSRVATPTVGVDDPLSATAGLFENCPCVPVLTPDGKIAGILFGYHVRLAYDREVSRQLLTHESGQS